MTSRVQPAVSVWRERRSGVCRARADSLGPDSQNSRSQVRRSRRQLSGVCVWSGAGPQMELDTHSMPGRDEWRLLASAAALSGLIEWPPSAVRVLDDASESPPPLPRSPCCNVRLSIAALTIGPLLSPYCTQFERISSEWSECAQCGVQRA